MTSNRRNVAVFSAAFLLYSIPTFFYLQQHGWDEASLGESLRISARLSLLIFLLIFVARPLRDLTMSPLSRTLVRNRRFLGIAFAAIMTAHLFLIFARHGFPAAYQGIVVYLFIYLMLITSFDTPTASIGPRRWKVLHKTGLYVVGIAITQGQFVRIWRGVAEPVHYFLAALILVAVAIRVAAWMKRRGQRL